MLVLVLDILLAIFARLQSAKAKRIGLETPKSLSRSPILEYNIGFIRIHISQYIEKKIENTQTPIHILLVHDGVDKWSIKGLLQPGREGEEEGRWEVEERAKR